nr:EAL domain-containing protein [Massilia sp. TS11]
MLAANLALALAYVLSGRLGLLLALPPGFASPLFPPAGIALASVYSGGWRMLPGVFAGALALNFVVPYPGGDPSELITIVAGLSTTIGAVLQAALGRVLLRRARPEFGAARDVLWLLAVAPLMCCVAPTVSLFTLLLLGALGAAQLPAAWLTWWVGDTIGVLLAAPLAWILFGRPRLLWHRRRWILGLPLLLAIGAFVTIYEQAVRWEREQQLQTYRLKAQQVGDLLQAQLSELEHFLATLAIAVQGDKQPHSAADFSALARSYLHDRPALSGMAWVPRVRASERARFEQALGAPVHDFAGRPLAAGTADLYPVRFIAPLKSSLAPGTDLQTDPGRASALARALQSRVPVASPPVRLLTPNKNGVILMQGVSPDGPDQLSGVLCLSIQPEVALRAVLAGANFPHMQARLDDADAAATLMADASLGAQPAPGEMARSLQFGGRSYRLRIAPSSAYLAQHRGWQSWSVLTGGLLLTGLLGALLLLVSAERVRIQALVEDRTAKLREREARLQAILDSAADAILTVDRGGRVISANHAACRLFAYPPEILAGLPLGQLLVLPKDASGMAPLLSALARRGSDGHELNGRTRSGASLPLAITVSAVALSEETLFVVIARDLTEQQRAQERIYRLAHHDALTGLENRFALNLRLEQMLQAARRTGEAVAVLFIDLDHFKKINDSQGHETGDLLLVSVAQRLRELLREMDTIARLGGDEFIVVMGGDPSPDAVRAVAVRIVESLSAPFDLHGKTAHSGASVGVAMYPADGADPGTLLRHADMAMYAAKGQGRGNFQFFSAAMNAATHEKLMMEGQLWQALERQEFELYLQPQVELGSGRVIGAEALLRWRHPELGMVTPDRFIPIAEESGQILPIGEWVLGRALALLASWQQGPLAQLRLAVNLSARQCHGAGLLPLLDGLLRQHAVAPQRLELEITESAAMQDPERTRQLLRALRERGIKVAIDDFGTGYSSLSYLKLFAIDRIKIDRGFVKDIESDPNDAVIVGATIALAHSLGLEVIAEGVETSAQRDFLAAKQCELSQGYLFARPLPLAEFEAFVGAAALTA